MVYLAKKTVNPLVDKLPMDGNQKFPSSESVVNICGVFNNLVTGSMSAARDIAQFEGLTKLMSIYDSRGSRLKHFSRFLMFNFNVAIQNFVCEVICII